MSIIIRLQNLPINAKSGDIRNFFRGLRIPDGGVHILGGEEGDAFIAFMSDEDARLAMRKDGGRIKGSQVKLFLSSHMEMEHEVGRLTKNVSDDLFKETLGELRSLGRTRRSKSPERRRRSRSRSPVKYSSYKSKYANEHYQHSSFNNSSNSRSRYRSRSPRRSRSRSPRRSRSRSPRRSRSHSPRRSRSRSPVPSYTSQKSYKSKTYAPRKRSVSPYPVPQIEEKSYNSSHSGWKSSDLHKPEFPSRSQIQSELEKRIAEELEKSYAFRKALNAPDLQESTITFDARDNLLAKDPYQQSQIRQGIHDKMLFSQDELMSTGPEQNAEELFYITMTGLSPTWNFREVQIMLKGIFAPHYNLRWEKDEDRKKTGIVFVKLTNKEDYESILQKGVFQFERHRIVVTKCPRPIAQEFFQSDFRMKNEKYIPQKHDLCFMLKGLPFSSTYSDVIQFFSGFEIADILVFYGNDGRATGTGFISFTNWKDFERAKALNGKKITHRYIELLPCTDRDMYEAKRDYSGGSFVPYSKILLDKKLPLSRRPLCALLTGLPLNTSLKKISSFFSESGLKPDAIHITLNKKNQSEGRAFVEFSKVLDFDLALKFHGQQLDNNTVCVKQILYDEMVKILDSQKAKHFFENAATLSPALDIPEKVPYLWEPPDGQEKFDNDASQSKILENSFSPNQNKKHFNQSFSNRGVGNLKEKFGTSSNDGTEFNVNKGIAHNPVFNESFHSTKKYEDNIKLSRLSPDNEAALLSYLNKDRNVTSELMHDRSNSPDDRRSRNFDDAKKYFKPKLRGNPRYKNKKNFKYNNDLEYNYNQNTPSRSDSFEDFTDSNDDSSKECIVQLINVNPSIGLDDLMHFLRGFKFQASSLIRRYTSEGEPTPDVRVTFQDRWEAERAIAELKGCYLRNRRVDMFIVSEGKN